MTKVFNRRIAGVVMIAVLALVAVLAVVRPGNPFADRFTYYAVFDTVQGLGRIDRDVRIAGVKSGEIGEVERIGDDVRVELVLTADVTVRADATAAMRPHTLFEGSNFVDLALGSPSAEVLEEGDTIPREQTTNYVTLDKALRVLRPDIRENLSTLARVGSRTLRGGAVRGLQRTLRNAPALLRPLKGAMRAAQGTDRDELAQTVAGMARTVDALERRSADLAPLVANTNTTVAALTTDGARPLDATIAALPGTLRELRLAAPELTGVVDSTRSLAVELTPALPDLRLALRDGVPVLRRTIPLAQDGTPLVRDARLIAGRLARARDELVQMFNLTGPSLDKFDSLFEVFNAETSLGAPSGVAQLVGGAFSGFDAVFRPFQTAAQDPAAPGHKGRLSVYVEPTGLLGLTEILGGGARGQSSPIVEGSRMSCERIAEVSVEVALQFRTVGECR